MKLLSGNSNKPLSKNISKYLKSKLVNSSIRNFSDGEIYVEINENIRGNSIFLIQSVSSPANDNLMEYYYVLMHLRDRQQKILLLLFRTLVMLDKIEKLHQEPQFQQNLSQI